MYSDTLIKKFKTFETREDFENELNGIDPFALKISIYDWDGQVIMSNAENYKEIDNERYLKVFMSIKMGESVFANKKDESTNDQVIAIFTKLDIKALDNYNPIIIGIEVQEYYNSYFFIYVLPSIIGLIIILIIIFYFCVSVVMNNALSPIETLNKNLFKISSGDYNHYYVTSKYRDVQVLVDEINAISSKISNNIKFLDYEKTKSNFIMENMSQGVIAVASNGDVILVNKIAEEMFDFKTALFGEGLESCIKDKRLLHLIKDSIAKETDKLFEYDINDKTFKIEVKNIYENWYDNKTGFISLLAFTDITQESQTVRIRNEFFANASHELRTPLTSIKGYSELLTIMDDEKTRQKCVAEIAKNANAMLALVTDMLNIARMEAQVKDDNREILELSEIASSVAEKLKPNAANKNIEMTISGEGKIFGNKMQIDEVFTNLMDNAIKYNKQNGFVKVDIKEIDNKVIVSVTDNGIGIDNAHHSKIFDRFYRVEKGKDSNVPSTGLGLSIVKTIVNLHSGKIAISSKVGVGTVFEIEFPSVEKCDIFND